jgi:hypothetical protein
LDWGSRQKTLITVLLGREVYVDDAEFAELGCRRHSG